MVKRIFTFLLFALIININPISAEDNKNNDPESSQIENLSFRLERLYKLYTEKKEYSQLARKSDIEIIQDRVVVAVLAKPGLTTADIDENDLEALGARIQAKAGHSMRVEIPISELVNVSNALKDLAEITLPLKPALDVTSEGVALMNADNWQDWGYDGTGVKIAIIDAGFIGLSAAQANGDIPLSYDSCNFTGSGFQATDNHGTAVTEAIFDLAPNAEFYLYKIADNIGFESAVDSCDSNDVDIINHSMSWVNAYGYYDGTGAICAIVDTALSHGRVWVNSAGNYARQHYRAQFNGGGLGSYHIFQASDTINPTGPYADGTQVWIALNWDNYPGTDQDYDLYLMQDTGNVTPKWVLVDSSVDDQLGASDPPQEMIIYTNPDAGAMYGVLVKNTNASAGNADFTIFSLNGGLNYYVDSSSIADPGTVTDVVTVGAIHRDNYASGPQEYFSSQGPTNDGRIKPDVAAPDYCNSFAKGHWYGTSLSSPHTAGVCALIKSRYPSFNDTETRTFLYNNCTVDLGTSGKDNIYGWGKVVMQNLDVTVTSPNGGENWYIDSTNNITWTSSGTEGAVKIEYSSDNGASWSDLIANMPDTGAYPWVIPNTPSDTCLVRITDTIGSPCDTSDAVFEISEPIPEITVTSPNGGEFWYIDSTNNITWTSFATSRGVQIEYSTNNGSSWLNVIASMPDTGAYPWLIPNTPSVSCLVRVTDTNGNVSDTSDAVFEIDTIPYITITYPNGGDSLYADSSYDITWITNLTVTDRVKIEYSTNLGTDWSEIIASKPADTLAYAWTVPNTPSDSCLVRISDSATGIPSDVSDAAFTILPIPYVTVTIPNGGEVWYIDSTYDITWTSEGTSDFLFIDYSIDSGANWLEVTSYVHPDSGSYAWMIPNTPSTNCFVRIGDSASVDHTPLDTSDAVFEIAPAPNITVTDPNGGETWYIDSTYDITWATNLTDPEGVIIEYSTNNGADWSEVVASKPADTLAYAWTIPNTPSDSCLVRITDTTTGSISDVSDAMFTITPASGVPTSEGPSVYSMAVKTVTAGNEFEVKYGLPENADVKFEVYDIKGTKIKEISEEQTSGFYSIQIRMTDKPAGVYFIRMSANAGAFNEIHKAILVK